MTTCTVAVVLAVGMVRASGVEAADVPASPEEVFAPGRVHTVHLRLSAAAWAMMQPGATAGRRRSAGNAGVAATRPGDRETYAEGDPLPPNPAGLTFAYSRAAAVEFDGWSLADVGVRFKGNISYLVSARSPRRSMKLDFPKGRFAGLATLNLNSTAFDPSQAREALAFGLFREMDVPAPRTGYATVYLTIPGQYDRECLGLYALVEEVDGRFLKRHFEDADGPLLKPERMRGLAYLGEDWAAYASRYNAKGEVAAAWRRRLIELARLINRGDDVSFRERVGLYLDVDEILRYVAVNSVIVNPDSFLSTGHNYYLYVHPADGRARFVPWDMNLSFGGYSWVASGEQSARMSITRAYADHNRLIERLLAIDEYARAYRRHVRRVAELLAPARLRERVAAMDGVLGEAARAAREAGRVGSATTRPIVGERLVAPELWSFVAARVASVRAQLDGGPEGFRPGFGDPTLLPPQLGAVARTGTALMGAADADGEELLTEMEVTAAARRALAAAGAGPGGGGAGRAELAKAIDARLRGEMRAAASGGTWAAWLIGVADANHDGNVDETELLAGYRRLLAGVDRDVDGMMCGREAVEALAGSRAPH